MTDAAASLLAAKYIKYTSTRSAEPNQVGIGSQSIIRRRCSYSLIRGTSGLSSPVQRHQYRLTITSQPAAVETIQSVHRLTRLDIYSVCVCVCVCDACRAVR